MKIRKITSDDAQVFLTLQNKLDEETEFRVYEPDERKTTPEEMEKIISSKQEDLILLAINDDDVVGYIEAERGKFNRNKHSAHINLAVLKKFHGRGIAKLFFDEVEKWAKLNDIHRLDLCVFISNTNAINLYNKMGFVKEGTKKDSFLVDGNYVDEFMMAKIIEK